MRQPATHLGHLEDLRVVARNLGIAVLDAREALLMRRELFEGRRAALERLGPRAERLARAARLFAELLEELVADGVHGLERHRLELGAEALRFDEEAAAHVLHAHRRELHVPRARALHLALERGDRVLLRAETLALLVMEVVKDGSHGLKDRRVLRRRRKVGRELGLDRLAALHKLGERREDGAYGRRREVARARLGRQLLHVLAH